MRIPLHVDWLVAGTTPLLDVPGRVGLSTCPGRPQSDVQLSTDLRHLQDLGITIVLSLVDEHEMRVYGVTGLAQALCACGLRHLRYPLIDGCPPPSLEDTSELCQQLLGLLGEGEHILIHCIGGWGRSGTIAASLLTHEGHDADTAIALVRQSRSPLCVESLAQEAFVTEYARQRPTERRYFPVPSEQAVHLVDGPPGARYLKPGAAALQPGLSAAELHHALPRTKGAQVVLSGEVVDGPRPVRPMKIDRVHRVSGQRLVPVPFSEVLGDG